MWFFGWPTGNVVDQHNGSTSVLLSHAELQIESWKFGRKDYGQLALISIILPNLEQLKTMDAYDDTEAHSAGIYGLHHFRDLEGLQYLSFLITVSIVKRWPCIHVALS